jgi:hypothetical protein
MYPRVTGVCYLFFHCEQRTVQEYVYCFLINSCAINYEELKTEHSTRYCVYAVVSQWLLCSYIHGLMSEKVCNINKVCLLIMFTVWSTRSPFLTWLSQRAESGRCSSFGKRVWFTESNIVLIISFYLFYLLNLFLI